MNAGTRQGGKASPLLFNIFVDDLVEELEKTRCGFKIDSVTDVGGIVSILLIVCLLYADDVVLFAKSPEELQTLLVTVERWARWWRVEFNVPKCKILMVYANRSMSKRFRERRFLLDGQRLELVRTFDYLGMETNAQLSLPHTPKRIREKVEKRVNFLRWVSASKNGLRSHVVLPLFWSIVRPLMTVNGQLATYSKTGLAHLETTQCMALKRIFKLPMFVKSASLRLLIGVPPIAATLDQMKALEQDATYRRGVSGGIDKAEYCRGKCRTRIRFNVRWGMVLRGGKQTASI